MVIPESQLEIWAKPQQTQSAINTHQSIRSALNSSSSQLKLQGFSENNQFEIYLQGSYRNRTNIRADSDVDVVVQLNKSFLIDRSNLSLEDLRRFSEVYDSPQYAWDDFYEDIFKTLRDYYFASSVTSGNKSIKLSKGSNRLAADIIPCIQYRYYEKFKSIDENYICGICFYTKDSRKMIINYPKLHYQNGKMKNHETEQSYKPTVRFFKNARNSIINKYNSRLNAPSYFVECLLYNVPNLYYYGKYQEIYANVVKWLYRNISNSFLCQNEMLDLFGNKSEQWNLEDAQDFLEGLVELWDNW